MRPLSTVALFFATGCLVGVDPAQDFAAGGNKAPRVGGLEVLLDDGVVPGPGAPATALTPLTCRPATLSDPDGDPLSITVRWFAGGQILQETTTDDALSVVAPTHQLQQAVRGQSITCALEVSDGRFTSEAASAPVAIANASPAVTTAAEEPEVTSLDGAMCVALVSDADGDATTTSWAWAYADGAPLTGSIDAPAASSLPGGAVNRIADVGVLELTCTARVEDGMGGLDDSTASVLVRNAPPEIVMIDVSNRDPSRNEVLTATATATDAEGNAVALGWSWRVDGIEVSTGSDTLDLPTVGAAGSGSVVQARVVASDAFGTGSEAFSPPALIVNEPPTVSGTTIVPSPPGVLDAASVTYTAVDPDGDPLNLAFLWTVDGELSAETSDTLPVGAFAKGSVLSVQVIATDPGGAVGVGFGQVVVADTGPEPPTVEIAPTYVWSSSTAIPSYAVTNPSRTIAGITCAVTAPSVDPDGDAVTYTYRLVRASDGAVVFTGQPVEATEYGLPVTTLDTYRCQVEATADGATASGVSGTADPVELVELPWYRLGAQTSCAKLTVTDGADTRDAIECWDANPSYVGPLDSPVYTALAGRSIADAGPDVGVGCVIEATPPGADGTVPADILCPTSGGAPTTPTTYAVTWADGDWSGSRPRLSVSPEGACALQSGDDFQCWGDLLATTSWCSILWSGQSQDPCPGGSDHRRLLDEVGPLASYQNGFCASEDSLPVLSPSLGLAGLTDHLVCYDFTADEPYAEVSNPGRVDQISVGWTGQSGCGVRGGALSCFGLGGAGDHFDPRRHWTSVAVVRPGELGVAFVAATEAGGRVWVASIGGTGPATATDAQLLWLDPGRTAACGANLAGEWSCVTDGPDPGLDALPPLDLVQDIVATNAWGALGAPNVCRVLEPDGHLVCDIWDSRGIDDLQEVPPPTDLLGVVALDVNPDVGCAIGDTGTVCWGDPAVAGSVPPYAFVDVAVEYSSYWPTSGACGLQASGQIRCWSDGAVVTHPGPYTALTQSADRVCGVSFLGAVTCFDCSTNLLGPRFDACPAMTPPFQTPGANRGAADGDWACVIDGQGYLTCWTPFDEFLPTRTFVDVGSGPPQSSGAIEVCALEDDGTLRCWNPDTGGAGATDTVRASQTPLQAADLSGQACGVDILQREVCWNGPALRRTLLDGAPLAP